MITNRATDHGYGMEEFEETLIFHQVKQDAEDTFGRKV
jgi:hypothetical protein